MIADEREYEENPLLEVEKSNEVDWEKYIKNIENSRPSYKNELYYNYDNDINLENIIKNTYSLYENLHLQVSLYKIDKIEKEGKMKAVVSITIDDEFVVHDIKVIEGEKGLFIAMPSRKASDGEYRDIAHPINSNTREKIQSLILEKYEEVMAEDAVADNA